jgi:hypothetical protein
MRQVIQSLEEEQVKIESKWKALLQERTAAIRQAVEAPGTLLTTVLHVYHEWNELPNAVWNRVDQALHSNNNNNSTIAQGLDQMQFLQRILENQNQVAATALTIWTRFGKTFPPFTNPSPSTGASSCACGTGTVANSATIIGTMDRTQRCEHKREICSCNGVAAMRAVRILHSSCWAVYGHRAFSGASKTMTTKGMTRTMMIIAPRGQQRQQHRLPLVIIAAMAVNNIIFRTMFRSQFIGGYSSISVSNDWNKTF